MRARILYYFAIIALSWGASARPVRSWSEAELQNAADLIVVATPIESKDLRETTSLGWDTAQTGVTFRGVETQFIVLEVIKGSPTSDLIVLHHYRQEGVPIPATTNRSLFMIPSTLPDGPEFIGFVLNKSNSFNNLVLYLAKDGANRYAPVTGQIDPARSFTPFNEVHAPLRFDSPDPERTTELTATQYFENYLDLCGTNEVRCLWFLGNNTGAGEKMTIYLDPESVYTIRDIYNWAKQATEIRTLSHPQVLTLRQIINDLPASDTNSEFNGSVFVAKRNGDKAEVFQYDRRHTPPVVRRIYDIGGGYLP